MIQLAVVWTTLLLLFVLGWWWWLRRDTKRYREYLHRSGQWRIPTPHGHVNVPSDDELRRGLAELDLPTERNPDGEARDEP